MYKRQHEHPPLEVDHAHTLTGGGKDGAAAPGAFRRVVGGPEQPRLVLEQLRNAFLRPDVVPGGQAVRAGLDQFIDDALADAEARGSVFRIDDCEVYAFSLVELREHVPAGDTARPADDVTDAPMRILAAEITRRYSKDEILRLYLNEVFYGSMAYGIDAAAETFFGKDAKDLTLAEAALLAGLALRAFHVAIPGRMEWAAVGYAAMSCGFAVCFHDALPEWTPLGVAFGVLAHQLGDLLTPEGLTVPVAWTWRRHATPSSARVKLPSWTVRVLWRQVTFGPMRTGGPLERWVIAPAAVAGMAVLVCHGATLPPLPA